MQGKKIALRFKIRRSGQCPRVDVPIDRSFYGFSLEQPFSAMLYNCEYAAECILISVHKYEYAPLTRCTEKQSAYTEKKNIVGWLGESWFVTHKRILFILNFSLDP